MALEIERKFLVTSDAFKNEAHNAYTIKQGFLNRDKARTVRVRLTDTYGFITVKGASSKDGVSRFEWEKEISMRDAEQLLLLCEPGIIHKKRYEINSGGHTFEVDVFFGANTGLIIAEIELSAAKETFKIPQWLGEEVTGDSKYYNSQLSKHAFKDWG